MPRTTRVNVLIGALFMFLSSALVFSAPAHAQRDTANDPGVDYGNGYNVTRLVGVNGEKRITIKTKVPNLGSLKHRKTTFILDIEGPRDFIEAATVIRWKQDGSRSASFMLLYPESAPDKVDCPDMRWSLKPAKRLVTTSFSQSCYAAAVGHDVRHKSKIHAFAQGPGTYNGDHVWTRLLRRG